MNLGDNRPPFDLSCFLPYQLNRVAALFSTRISAVYRAEQGMGIPEWRVLALLGPLGEGASLTATEAGRLSTMHKTKVSRAVAKLVERRWLRQETDAHDKRVEQLYLTAEGARVFAALAPKMLTAESAVLSALTPEERAALTTGLLALERALGD